MDHAAPRQRRIFLPVQWLISPRADLVGLLGSVSVAWGLFLLWTTGILSTTQVVLFWVFVLHGPHFWATISRTYADREQFRRRRKLYLGSLGWYLIGPVIIAVGVFFHQSTGRPDLIQLFFLLAMMWAFHHVAKQHFGFLALYRAKHREFNKREFLFSKYYLLTSLWMPGVILLVSNQMLEQLPGVAPYWHSGEHAIVVIQSTQRFIHTACYATFWVAQACFAGFVLWKIISGRGANLPALLLIMCCVPLTWVVIMTSLNTANFGILVPILTSYHNVQYHTLVWYYNKHKYARNDLTFETRRSLGLATWLNKNIVVYLVFGLLFTFGTIGFEYYGVAALAETSTFSLIMKAFFFGFAFHHYYLDSKIWHASEDAELRQILGFQGPKKPAPSRQATGDRRTAPSSPAGVTPARAKVPEAG